MNMLDYTPHEIIDMILILRECRGNYRTAARLYRERYLNWRYASIQVMTLMQAERAFTERLRLCMHMRGRQFEYYR